MGRLVCDKVTKVYGKGATALDKVSFNVPASGIFALIGRNGAGKTTLVRILTTELMLSSGKATIDGVDVTNDPSTIRDMVAIVPQEARLLMWTTPKQFILAYLLYRGYGYKEAVERAAEAVKRVKIEKFADKQSQHLSGGTKRKALVAAVIAAEAKILFLDEPTTGLDPISRGELWAMLNQLKKDHFIFLTTHYLEEAERLADMIGIIEDGKLLAIGTLDNLRKKVKHEYSVRILQKGINVRLREGEVVTGLDGHRQILTTEREANRISQGLIKRGIRFSSSPISLEEIFYYLTKKSIDIADEEKEGNGGWQ